MVQVPCQTDIQTLKNGLEYLANQRILNVWLKSHMCLGCLFFETVRKMHFTDIEVNNTKLW